MWLAMDNIIGFLEGSFLILIALFLGGFFKLYLQAKMKIRTILIISTIMFILGEAYLIYYIFLEQK